MRLPRLFILGAILSLFGSFSSYGAEKLSDAKAWIPENAFFIIDINDPQTVLAPLLSDRFIEKIKNTDSFKAVSAQNEFKNGLLMIGFLEHQLKTDWKTAIRSFFGDHVLFAVTTGGDYWFIADSSDAELLAGMTRDIVNLLKSDPNNSKPNDWGKSVEVDGVTCTIFGEHGAFALLENRFIFSKNLDSLKSVLNAGTRKSQNTLADNPRFLEAEKNAEKNRAGFAYLDVPFLKTNPEALKWYDEQSNPMNTLLFSTLMESIKNSDVWTASLSVLKTPSDSAGMTATYTVTISSDMKTETVSKTPDFSWPNEGEQTLPNLSVPDSILSMSFYRDLYTFYKTKDVLFPERTSELIFFENMMGIFFSGRNLTEEVFAELGPDIRFVLAGQRFDENEGVPQIHLPSFALVFRANDPKNFKEVAEEAWQKAIGLVAITSGQKGSGGLIIDRDTYKEVKYYFSYFGTSRLEDKKVLPIQYNFRPSIAIVDDFVVLASTAQVTEDLIDAIRSEKQNHSPGNSQCNTVIEFNAKPLYSLFKTNKSSMIQNNMVEKGISRQEAETNFDRLLFGLEILEKAGLSVEKENNSPHFTAYFSL